MNLNTTELASIGFAALALGRLAVNRWGTRAGSSEPSPVRRPPKPARRKAFKAPVTRAEKRNAPREDWKKMCRPLWVDAQGQLFRLKRGHKGITLSRIVRRLQPKWDALAKQS